jgi:glyoxylase-like metal-dependent hydrolase (beta-lactamase superfamily II)
MGRTASTGPATEEVMRRSPWLVSLAPAFVLTAAALAQPDPSQVELKTEKVADGIYMVSGGGGNVGVSAGEDGVFLIDDQYAPLTEKLTAAVAAISHRPIRFVLNTHWHDDHTGGNENLGKKGTLIVAHDNVRKQMSVDHFLAAFNMEVKAAPPAALPVVTFNDAVTFHLNGQEIHAFHVEPAHTDGDSIVHFRKANEIHMGDVFFNGLYPFIDTSVGGNADGVIAAAEAVLAMADDDTRIMPGHGPVSGKAELAAYVEMLRGVRDAVAVLVAAGKSREEAVAAKPTAPWDEKWGKGFLPPDVFAGIVYDGLK